MKRIVEPRRIQMDERIRELEAAIAELRETLPSDPAPVTTVQARIRVGRNRPDRRPPRFGPMPTDERIEVYDQLGLSVRYGAWFDRQSAEDLDCPAVLRILARPGFLDEPMRVTWLAAKIRADPDSAGVKNLRYAITKLELMGLLRREPVIEGRKHRWRFSLVDDASAS